MHYSISPNSIVLAIGVAFVLTVAIGLALVYGKRLNKDVPPEAPYKMEPKPHNGELDHEMPALGPDANHVHAEDEFLQQKLEPELTFDDLVVEGYKRDHIPVVYQQLVDAKIAGDKEAERDAVLHLADMLSGDFFTFVQALASATAEKRTRVLSLCGGTDPIL